MSAYVCTFSEKHSYSAESPHHAESLHRDEREKHNGLSVNLSLQPVRSSTQKRKPSSSMFETQTF